MNELRPDRAGSGQRDRAGFPPRTPFTDDDQNTVWQQRQEDIPIKYNKQKCLRCLTDFRRRFFEAQSL